MSRGPFDLLIRHGTIVDGTVDAIPVVADLGIDAGWITAIGDLATTDATETIDATGLTVAPGFIDPHTHVESAILDGRDDAMAPALQGVTTILTAPDGFGWAPLERTAADELWTATAGIHGPMPRAMDPTSIERYLAGFDGVSPVNVLPQAPHAAIRFAAMGWRDGAPGPAELDRMRGLVAEWLAAGATGLSVGLDYEPGGRATEAELLALCELVADHGGSIGAHIRYEDLGRSLGYAEMGRIGERSGVRVNLAHERLDEEGAIALASVAEVADVAIETYLYGPSSTQLSICLPAHLRQGGPVAMAARLAEPAGRAEVADVLATRLGADRAAGDRIVFAASGRPDRIGREIAEVAAAQGVPLGTFAATVLLEDPAALFVYHHDGRPDPDRVFERTMSHPSSIVASDGIYVEGRMHPRGYGTFARVLGTFVRERGTLSLAEGIHKMSGRTADRYRVPDRGTIAVGRAADLVIFDPATIIDRATDEMPRRPPIGIQHVLVNGRAVVSDGQPTPARPGLVLAVSGSA